MGSWVNELELARAWNISRTPIRDALRRLEAEGLVQAVPGKGILVPTLSRKDMVEIYDLRESLEGLAARRAAENSTPEFVTRLGKMMASYEAAVSRDDMDKVIAVDIDFHGSIAKMSGNARLERAIDNVRAQVHLFRVRTVRLENRPRRTLQEMAPLITAIGNKDGDEAETSMRRHIANLREELLQAFHDVMSIVQS